jgi:large subunit ribosomal protein L19
VPWTPTSQLDKRKTYQSRSRHILNNLKDEYHAQVGEDKRNFPTFKPGDIIQVDLVRCSRMLATTVCTYCMQLLHAALQSHFTARSICANCCRWFLKMIYDLLASLASAWA